MVFAQNLGAAGSCCARHHGDLHWDPAHTFALDGSDDATPASSTTRASRRSRWAEPMSAAQGIGVGERQRRRPRPTARPHRRRSRRGRRMHALPPAAAGHGLAGGLLRRPARHAALDLDPDPARGRRDRRLHADLPVRQLRRRARGVRRRVRPVVPLRAASPPLLALAISYPLAYAIAFKAGRWRNLLLVLVVAPFFTSFLLRTIAWKQILADEAWVADALRFLHVHRPAGPHHQHGARRGASASPTTSCRS